MLPKNRRILRQEFEYILKNGRRLNSPTLLLYIAQIQTPKQNNSRFSFSISKKIFPNAVDRNKRRRWGYSIVSSLLKQIKPGFYCFFSYKKTAKTITFPVIQKEVSELLSNSGMLL